MLELSDTLDGPQWLSLLERLASQLGNAGEPVRLCLIGSSACLFGGMESRTSRDLDVWLPMSDYDRRELQQAVEAVGLLYNPKSSLEPDRPYLQIVEPGVVDVGEFAPVRTERIGRLHLLGIMPGIFLIGWSHSRRLSRTSILVAPSRLSLRLRPVTITQVKL